MDNINTVKAYAFDVMLENQQLKAVNSSQAHILRVLAHKMGVSDISKLDINAMPDMFDNYVAQAKRDTLAEHLEAQND